ncbi:MAG TPA: tetratricopeptide repeat protein [Planctomycetaceae bacterium]|nr:tetratricopeptide repeat protein [Planctomycetaceae bacterium]
MTDRFCSPAALWLAAAFMGSVVATSWPGWARGAETTGDEPSGRWGVLSAVAITGQRSRQLELIARQADRHTRRGFELAGRKAFYAARAQFVLALRLLSQGLDAERQDPVHTKALAVGLRAIQEADDFVPIGSQLEADLDLAAIVRGHQTPVFSAEGSLPVTPMEAFAAYLSFAQEQLAEAAGDEVAGSMALYGLGKLHTTMAGSPYAGIQAAQSKAMAFYQASLLVDPSNYLAANELGVLLARNDRYLEARRVLEHCAAISRSATAWHNLAVVYQRLGLEQLARRAEQRARRVAATNPKVAAGRTGTAVDVRWVPFTLFSQAGSGAGGRDTSVATGKHQPAPSPGGRTARSRWAAPETRN